MTVALEPRFAIEPSSLLDRYEPDDSWLLASPRQSLLGRGVRALVPGDRTGLARRATVLLHEQRDEGVSQPVLMGAIPFESSAPAWLVAPATIERSGPLAVAACSRPAAAAAAPDVRPVPHPSRYVRGVREALAELDRGELRKVVLARALDVHGPVDVAAILRRLARHDPQAYTFAVALPPQGTRVRSNRTLLGASPELLVRRRGREVVAHPLAGSAPRSAYAAEDARRATALLASAKDRHEHALVVEAVQAALEPLCATLAVPREPRLVRTGAMWHLGTRISGRLEDPGVTSLDLAEALHPTPAVCGTPVAAAKATIRRIEPFERGFYGGLVGWCDADGDGEWVVAIRCAEAGERSLRLYAGAGIVAGSEPESELAETAAKCATLLQAMGLEGVA
jgi:isochorismate synthase